MNSKRHGAILVALLVAGLGAPWLHSDERKIDPTFLYRDTAAVKAKPSDLTTEGCHYKPLFGQGDADASALAGIARYGEAVIDPNGACAPVQYPDEDQVYVVLDGKAAVKYGNETVSLNKEDYLYLPSTVPHTLSNSSGSPLTVVVWVSTLRDLKKHHPRRTL